MINTFEVPTGVKIISVFYYIGAVFGIIFGILFMVGAGLIGALGAGLFIFVGIILLALSILGFFIGGDYGKRNNGQGLLQ